MGRVYQNNTAFIIGVLCNKTVIWAMSCAKLLHWQGCGS